MEDTGIGLQLLLQLTLIALNAVFASAEIAVITMNDARIAKLAAAGDRRAVRLARLTSQPARFLATIQVAITLSGFLGSAFAADNFSGRITTALVDAGTRIPAATLDAISVVLITLLLSFVTLVLGELVPKRVAMKKAEKLALGMSGLIAFVSRAFAPIVWLLTVTTNGVLRLLGIDPSAQEESVTEEEIRMMIDAGSEKGTIDEAEKRMLQNVFEFDDVTAEQALTHRTQVDLLWMEEDDRAWEKTIYETRHARYPVCADSTDNIVGVLDAKDYFRLPDRKRESVMKSAVAPAWFVLESTPADVLFYEMKKTRRHFAVVVDEYGGMSGIITLSDLLEEIVGDLPGDDDDPLPEYLIEREGDNLWRTRGPVPLDALSEALGITLSDSEFETLGGLALSTLPAVPADGSRFTARVAGLSIEATEIKNRTVAAALVRLEPNAEQAEAAG